MFICLETPNDSVICTTKDLRVVYVDGNDVVIQYSKEMDNYKNTVTCPDREQARLCYKSVMSQLEMGGLLHGHK